MPFVRNASNSRHFSMYLAKPNATWDVGKNWYYAQTFALTTQSTIWRECFMLCATMPLDLWHFSIRLTDGAGKPLSVDLYHDTRVSSNTPTCNQKRPGWQCMDWAFHLLPAGTYAIVIGRPGSPDPMRGGLTGSTGVTTTPTSKAWVSDDYGVTWTEMPNTVLNHACWGHVPPVTPPTPPEIGNWYIKTIVYNERPDGLQVVVTTDRLITLYLRWTLAPPGQHIKEVMTRGAPVQKVIDQCFVATNDINQVEEGDTLTHTFNVDGWPVCQTRWFYFWGTRAMKRVPSVSPIYEKHRVAPTVPTVICQAPPNMDSRTFQHTICYDDSYVKFKPLNSITPTTLTVYVRWGPYAPQPKTICLTLWTTLATGYPGTKIGGPWYFIWNPINNGLPQAVDVPLPLCPALTAGQHYEFRVAYAYDGVKAGYWYTSLDSTNSCPPDAGYRNLVRIRKNWVWPCCGTIIAYSPGYGQAASGYKLWGLPV